jgi:hypothetical protein
MRHGLPLFFREDRFGVEAVYGPCQGAAQSHFGTFFVVHDAGPSLAERFSYCLRVRAKTGYNTDAGDHHPIHAILSIMFFSPVVNLP